MTDNIKNSANQFSENFETLVTQIKSIGDALQQDARVVINRNITTKAWLTGYYIVEYEQHGNDRASSQIQAWLTQSWDASTSVLLPANPARLPSTAPAMHPVLGARLPSPSPSWAHTMKAPCRAFDSRGIYII